MDEMYISRGEFEENLWKSVFSSPAEEDGVCLAINGPNNIGKTTLIKEMLRRFRESPHDNVFCFSTTLNGKTSINQYWLSLFRIMRMSLGEQVLRRAPKANDETVENLLSALDWFDAARAETVDQDDFAFWLEYFFPALRSIGIKIILIIDEFDLAQTMCTDGLFFGQLFNLSPKGISTGTHSVILVSRKHLSTIEHHMSGGSHLPDAYPEKVLRGFTNAELNEYFRTYEKLPCGLPGMEMFQDIMYYCGRNPGLLMRMRDNLCHSPDGNIARLFIENIVSFTKSYDRMIALMQEEHIYNNDNSLRCFDVFLEDFIGPVTNENHINQMKVLFSRGFITEVIREECSIDVVAGMNDTSMTNLFAIAGLEEDRGDVFYEPISLFFVQYVKDVYLPNEKGHVASMLVNVETKCRKGIAAYLFRLFGDGWEKQFDSIVDINERKKGYLKTLKRQIDANDGAERGITGSILDVLSFNEYYSIIVRMNLSGFIRYFDNPSRDMTFLNDCRNLHAHRNMYVLNETNLKRLSSICADLIRGIDESINDLNGTNESGLQQLRESIAEPNRSDTAGSAQQAEADDNCDPTQFVQTTVDMISTVFKSNRGNLVGFVKGTRLKVSVPSTEFATRGQSARIYQGKTVQVKIIRWDSNPASPHFEAILI